jgi:hypothetical protein
MPAEPPAAAIARAACALLRELVDGADRETGWVLNPGDPGLLRSLDRLSAAAASAPASGGGPSIAAHVDHLRYGLELLNRWGEGADPFSGADYAASWRRPAVSEHDWRVLREGLRAELARWREIARQPRDRDPAGHLTVFASVVHLAYHLGAIRQIDRATRGPAAEP